MTPTIYRRQSMATLYEKLRAQDGEDHMAWLAEVTAEFDADDKPEHFVPSIPSPPSTISSASSSTTSSPQNTTASLDLYYQSDGDYESDSDSDSDSEIEPIHNSDGILFQPYNAVQYPSDFLACTLGEDPDLPYIPPVECCPPTSLGYSPASQITPPMEDAPPSSFILPTAPPPEPHAVDNSVEPVMRSTRSFPRRNAPAALERLGDDAEGSSGAEETDDEYIPSPSISSPRKRRHSSRNASTAAGSSNHRLSSTAKRPRPDPSPRNVQAIPGITPTPARKSNPWSCPYCTWIQRNHRTPDLKRHIRTHTRFERPAQWVCCGIPLESASMYGVPHDATPYFRDGKKWVGGCGKEFSRRDALKRHLGNDHISCIGDIDAFANVFDD